MVPRRIRTTVSGSVLHGENNGKEKIMRKYTIKQNITDGKQEEVLQAEEILEDKVIDKKIIAKIRNTRC